MTQPDDSFSSIAAQIVANTPDAVIHADREGVIRLWNDGATRIFGHSAEEAVGASLDIIIPEKHRGPHWSGWDRVMATGETRYSTDSLSVPGVHADGSKLALEFSIAILQNTEGEIEGIAAILRDTTKRWEQTQALRAQIRELKNS